ncbi:MAG: hypothetical protein ACLR6J_00845 [Parabacteroides merdae]
MAIWISPMSTTPLWTLAYCGKSSIRNGSQLNIDSKYSNLSLGNVRKMNTEAKYGDIHIDRLDNGYMELKYGNCKIDELKQGAPPIDELSYRQHACHQVILPANFDKSQCGCPPR